MRGQLIIDKTRFRAVLYVLCAYINIWAPYHGDNTMYLSGIATALKYFQYGVFVIIFVMYFRDRKTISNKAPLIALLGCSLYTVFPWIYSYNGEGISGILSLFLVFIFLIDDEECHELSFIYFRNVWIVLSALGIAFYIINITNLPIGFRRYNYYGQATIYQEYNSYGIIYIYKSYLTTRLCGICNEPGWWGTVSGLLLCADKMDLRKKSNWIIGVAGLFSVSLAFTLIVFLYILCLARKNKKVFLFLLVIFLLYFFVLPNVKTGIVEVDGLLARIKLTESGLAGDNRSNEIVEDLLGNMIENKPFFGYGTGYTSAHTVIGSLRAILIDYGLLGSAIMYGLLLCSALLVVNHNLYGYYFVISFFASIYQRCIVFNLIYMLLLFGGIQYINNRYVLFGKQREHDG